MSKVYVVMGTTGEYFESESWPVLAFDTREAAEEHVGKCVAWATDSGCHTSTYWSNRAKNQAKLKAWREKAYSIEVAASKTEGSGGEVDYGNPHDRKMHRMRHSGYDWYVMEVEVAPGGEDATARVMKCRHSEEYKCSKPPRCRRGLGCDACRARWQVAVATDASEEELDLMRHATGFESRDPFYRNRFCADAGSKDDITMARLTVAGLVTLVASDSGYNNYRVTEAGCRVLRARAWLKKTR